MGGEHATNVWDAVCFVSVMLFLGFCCYGLYKALK